MNAVQKLALLALGMLCIGCSNPVIAGEKQGLPYPLVRQKAQQEHKKQDVAKHTFRMLRKKISHVSSPIIPEGALGATTECKMNYEKNVSGKLCPIQHTIPNILKIKIPSGVLWSFVLQEIECAKGSDFGPACRVVYQHRSKPELSLEYNEGGSASMMSLYVNNRLAIFFKKDKWYVPAV